MTLGLDGIATLERREYVGEFQILLVPVDRVTHADVGIVQVVPHEVWKRIDDTVGRRGQPRTKLRGGCVPPF